MKRLSSFLALIICVLACSKKVTKPSYIEFNTANDSIYISAVNRNTYPFHVYAEQDKKTVTDITTILPGDSKEIMRLPENHYDTLSVLNDFNFVGAYGNPNMTTYDSLFNYQLPFPKHKSYKILQGHDTKFTHNGTFSRYAIDFKMPIGDTICAARSGYIAGVIDNFDKNGKDVTFRDYANFITVYHDDGTFSQYVHLKKNGSLVQQNQRVEQGEPIGLSGNTGWSTEPHLHFAVFKSIPKAFESIPIILNGKDSHTYKKWDIVSH